VEGELNLVNATKSGSDRGKAWRDVGEVIWWCSVELCSILWTEKGRWLVHMTTVLRSVHCGKKPKYSRTGGWKVHRELSQSVSEFWRRELETSLYHCRSWPCRLKLVTNIG